MDTYRHLLLAVDFSPEAALITQRGRDLAERYDARLSIIHVVEFSSSLYPAGTLLTESLDLDQRLLENAGLELKELVLTHGLGAAKRHVEIGVPKQEIIRVAEEIGADLIVIGSHGRHGIQLLLGSTANGVLNLAKCDVLAVRVGLS